MNWYKRAQAVVTNPESQGTGYLDIGHRGWRDEGGYIKRFKKPNMIWALIDGYIYKAEESSEVSTHGEAWGGISDPDQNFSGRYEPDSGKLSITIPYSSKTLRARRQVPNSILKRLLREFPETSGVYIF